MDIEALAEQVFGDDLPAEREHFEVTDYKTADWCLMTAKRAADDLAKIDAYYNELRDRLDAMRDRAAAEAQRTVERMEQLLRPFAERELAGKKKRSFELVNGKMGFRKLPDRVEWDSVQEDVIIDWAEKYAPDAVRVRKSLLKTELKKAIDAGVEVPLVSCEDGQDKFYIDVT
jgi:hypothetical protein